MNINWKTFITSDYWLDIDRAGMHLTDKIILWFGVALVAIAIIILVVRLVSKNSLKKSVYDKIIAVFLTVGLLEMLWFVLRSQYVNALGTRLAALIVGLIGLFYLRKPIKYLLFEYRKDAQQLSKQQLKDKYLQR